MNDFVKQRLTRLVEKNCLPHLLLFTGPKDSDKKEFAHSLVQTWLKNDCVKDLHHYTPEGKLGMHSIQSIRRFVDEVALAPFGSHGKAFIIEDADRMLPTSANALLKTLEEPPANTLIILLSSAKERMLPTILSRCQEVRFCPTTTYGADVAPVELKSFVEIAQFAKEFQKGIDSKKKAHEQELKSQFSAQLKEASASQRQLIEQEIEGALALITQEEVSQLFSRLLAHAVAQERACETNKLPTILKSLQQALMAIERSSPIQSTVESLLLQIIK